MKMVKKENNNIFDNESWI